MTERVGPDELDIAEGFEAVLSVVEKAAALGVATSKDGARMYGRTPHVAAQAWLHVVYPSLNSGELADLEQEIKRRLPPPYAAFLRKTNGLTLFSGALDLYGRRTDYSRDPNIRQPFDLSVPNVKERPRAARNSWFIIASYKADGSCAYMDNDDPRVFRASRDMSITALNEWPSLGRFLYSEVHRLAIHFDALGRRIDSSRPTTPE